MRRRTLLRALGLAAGAGTLGTPASAAPLPWADFDRQVRAEFARERLVGAAVAIVSADRVLHRLTLGHTDPGRRTPISPRTHFLVASTTKSMSSLLAATYVDEGVIGWDQRAVDAWSGFRAPTPELTRTLRVRDLLGMGTGIGEPAALSTLHEGFPTAEQLLQQVVNLPVEAPPETRWIYNNTVYATGGYLPLLASGVRPADVAAAWVNAIRTRVFAPAGMTTSTIADDPRGVVADYSRGNGVDIFGGTNVLPYGPVGSYAPAGGTLSTLDDMASYVRLQLRRGRSVTGRRVVSAANLAECWRPHVDVPIDPVLDPDGVAQGYGMGWIRERFTDGTSLVWHNGAIDGFTAYVGFLPERDLGLVVLNNLNPEPTGLFLYLYVLNLILSSRFGLNEGVPPKVSAAAARARETLTAKGPTTRPVDPRRVGPWLGYYEGGYLLALDRSRLVLALQSRRFDLRWVRGETYLMADGLVPGATVLLRRDPDGTPTLAVAGVETVRREVGPN
ncbi:CubicO group peptidase, beta-lactamase class C family [Asanoa hainanensis]|uniref:CubicO group peptidase, beta-lactamase class C family n=1 Tax=Asanoa hainanensis TaxID=560556 RepID=A0A239PAB4_9ACTN|nr:serine hydrolase domain-containing protein [Asanoa hainanensis]SNT64096.1 CubicO group peptidase, beta-lactamase class C family [Asanoa hainanensis]